MWLIGHPSVFVFICRKPYKAEKLPHLEKFSGSFYFSQIVFRAYLIVGIFSVFYP
jgi:amino acid permease